MSDRVVLTAIGADRPGLVQEVSEFVLARGGNVEDSRMANLHGQFAIMMAVAGAREAIGRIAAELEVLERETGLGVRVTPAAGASGGAGPRLPFRLAGRALDQPGLVHEVADVLRALDVNIESLDTTLESAPVTGAPVFAMELVLAVPAKTSVQDLRSELGRVCDTLNVDWHLAAL